MDMPDQGLAGKGDPMSTSTGCALALSQPLRALEGAYELLNATFFEGALSKAVITISPTPGCYGHFTPWKSWKGKDGSALCEINLGAETLDRSIEHTIATLLHEMVHQYCHERGIKDTSRGNTYHNKRFKAEAEKRGLVIGYDKRIGHSPTKPGPIIVEMVKAGKFDACIDELCRVGGSRCKEPGGSGKRRQSSTRKYMCPRCGMSVRATKEVRIECMDCGRQMMTKEDMDG